MGEITKYFGEIIVITAVSGLLLTAAPEGGLKKYLKFIISVALTASLLVPLLSVAVSLPKVFLGASGLGDGGETAVTAGESALLDVSAKELEGAICDYVANKYGLDRGQLRCRVTLDASDTSAVRIVKIRLFLPQDCRREEIRRALLEMFLYQSEIEIGEVT